MGTGELLSPWLRAQQASGWEPRSTGNTGGQKPAGVEWVDAKATAACPSAAVPPSGRRTLQAAVLGLTRTPQPSRCVSIVEATIAEICDLSGQTCTGAIPPAHESLGGMWAGAVGCSTFVNWGCSQMAHISRRYVPKCSGCHPAGLPLAVPDPAVPWHRRHSTAFFALLQGQEHANAFPSALIFRRAAGEKSLPLNAAGDSLAAKR